MLQQYLPFTVLKLKNADFRYDSGFGLQQYLPFTVLKHDYNEVQKLLIGELQQYLPFTVLKPSPIFHEYLWISYVATVLTVYGIETKDIIDLEFLATNSCNSTYRLRY